jgi:hypothetical protein
LTKSGAEVVLWNQIVDVPDSRPRFSTKGPQIPITARHTA